MIKASRQDVLQAWRQLLRVERKITELEKEKDEAKDKLAFLIPQGSSAFGVRHIRIERRNVAWKKVYEVCLETLIPKTRKSDAEAVVSDATSTSAYSKFEAEEKEKA